MPKIDTNQLAALRLLAIPSSSFPLKKAVVSTANKDFIDLLLGLILAVVQGRLVLDPADFQQLQTSKTRLHSLVLPNCDISAKHSILLRPANQLLLHQVLGYILPYLSTETDIPSWQQTMATMQKEEKDSEAATALLPHTPAKSETPTPPSESIHPPAQSLFQ